MAAASQPDSSASVIEDRNTLLAVLQFLSKHKLKESESILRKEAQIPDLQVNEATSYSDVSSALAVYKQSEGSPTNYELHYGNLREFIEGSLEVHKFELNTILYPVFVHMYLELVYNERTEAANNFFTTFSPLQEDYYADDLRILKTITKPEHMRGSQLLENFKSSKFIIRMARESYNQLKRFLESKRLKALLTIVQDRLFIDVFDGKPRSKLQIDVRMGSVSGESRKDANKVRVFYGLPKEPEMSILPDEEEEMEVEDRPKKKKAKKESALSKKQRTDPNAPTISRIPLPELRDQDKTEKIRAFRESLKRVAISPDQLPSVAFYTLLHSKQIVTCVEISEDSSLLAAGFQNSKIKIWNLQNVKLCRLKSGESLELIDKEASDVQERMMDLGTASDSKNLHGHAGPVYAVSFSPDRSLLISGSEDGTVRLWSLFTWSNLICYKGHNFPVWDVSFSPHGHYFISCGLDRTIRMWSTEHPQALRIFCGHLSDVDCIDYHPNSNYIASGSSDRTVRVWDVQNGNQTRTFTGHKGPILRVKFSPCGRFVASSSTDNSVMVWDIATGDIAARFEGHRSNPVCLAFSRDGMCLASGSLDNTIRCWDVSKLTDEAENDSLLPQSILDCSSYEIVSYRTKRTQVLCLQFSRRNLLLGCGPIVS